MAKTAMTIDVDPLLKKMIKTNRVIKQRAEKGIGRALIQLKADMILQKPTAPIKEGFLRGSTSIFVQNKPVEVPSGPDEDTTNKVEHYTVSIKKAQMIGIIGVNVPYAARHHEVPANFTEPSAGNKYLESKMSRYKMTYKKIIVNTINEGPIL